MPIGVISKLNRTFVAKMYDYGKRQKYTAYG